MRAHTSSPVLPWGGALLALLCAGCAKHPSPPARPEPKVVLDEVARLPVSTWSYKWEPGQRHLGPMAQDFHAAFGLGGDPRTYDPRDADAVSLEALQALTALADEQDRRIARLETENRRLEAELSARARVACNR